MLWLALHCPLRSTGNDAAASLPDDGPCGGIAVAPDAPPGVLPGVRPGVRPAAPPVAAAAFPTPALACWAGRFTSQVNLVPAALRLEIGGSLRLFGGLPALLQKVRADLAAMGIAAQLAVAATPLAALWLARSGDNVVARDLAATRARLAAVPLSALELAPPLMRRLEGCGLHHLGELLALPRANLGTRLGKGLVVDLARALGEIPDPQTCFIFPEYFEQGLELPAPVDTAPVLLFAARRLVAALAGWLAARNSAVREIEWQIDHGHGRNTVVPIAFSAPVHRAGRIERVLKERFDALDLSAPALALHLFARHAAVREGGSHVLFDASGQRHEALAELTDRLVARLGPQAVQGLACHADHRPERASRPGPVDPAARPVAQLSRPPRPLWLVDPPEALGEVQGRPQCIGALMLAAGPERIEAGWWDGADARRDYFIAIDAAGRWLWIFRDPRPPGGWFLHGWFA